MLWPVPCAPSRLNVSEHIWCRRPLYRLRTSCRSFETLLTSLLHHVRPRLDRYLAMPFTTSYGEESGQGHTVTAEAAPSTSRCCRS